MIHFGAPSSGGTDSTFAPARLTEGLIVVDDGNDASLTPADPVDQTHVGHRPIHGLNDSGPDGRRLDRRSLIQIDVGRGRLAQRGEEIESHAMIDLVAAGAGFALCPRQFKSTYRVPLPGSRGPRTRFVAGLGPWWGVPGDQCPARAGSLSGEGICSRCIEAAQKPWGSRPRCARAARSGGPEAVAVRPLTCRPAQHRNRCDRLLHQSHVLNIRGESYRL